MIEAISLLNRLTREKGNCMTWKEFKNSIDEFLSDSTQDDSIEIDWIEFTGVARTPDEIEVTINEQDMLYISG